MPKVHVITRNYSQHWDISTETQFTEILEVSTGLKIGHAYVEQDVAGKFASRPAFKVVSDDEYAGIVAGKPQAEPTAPVTGDPIGDAAKANAQPSPAIPAKAQPANTGDPIGDAAKAAVK